MKLLYSFSVNTVKCQYALQEGGVEHAPPKVDASGELLKQFEAKTSAPEARFDQALKKVDAFLARLYEKNPNQAEKARQALYKYLQEAIQKMDKNRSNFIDASEFQDFWAGLSEFLQRIVNGEVLDDKEFDDDGFEKNASFGGRSLEELKSIYGVYFEVFLKSVPDEGDREALLRLAAEKNLSPEDFGKVVEFVTQINNAIETNKRNKDLVENRYGAENYYEKRVAKLLQYKKQIFEKGSTALDDNALRDLSYAIGGGKAIKEAWQALEGSKDSQSELSPELQGQVDRLRTFLHALDGELKGSPALLKVVLKAEKLLSEGKVAQAIAALKPLESELLRGYVSDASFEGKDLTIEDIAKNDGALASALRYLEKTDAAAKVVAGSVERASEGSLREIRDYVQKRVEARKAKFEAKAKKQIESLISQLERKPQKTFNEILLLEALKNSREEIVSGLANDMAVFDLMDEYIREHEGAVDSSIIQMYDDMRGVYDPYRIDLGITRIGANVSDEDAAMNLSLATVLIPVPGVGIMSALFKAGRILQKALKGVSMAAKSAAREAAAVARVSSGVKTERLTASTAKGKGESAKLASSASKVEAPLPSKAKPSFPAKSKEGARASREHGDVYKAILREVPSHLQGEVNEILIAIRLLRQAKNAKRDSLEKNIAERIRGLEQKLGADHPVIAKLRDLYKPKRTRKPQTSAERASHTRAKAEHAKVHNASRAEKEQRASKAAEKANTTLRERLQATLKGAGEKGKAFLEAFKGGNLKAALEAFRNLPPSYQKSVALTLATAAAAPHAKPFIQQLLDAIKPEAAQAGVSLGEMPKSREALKKVPTLSEQIASLNLEALKGKREEILKIIKSFKGHYKPGDWKRVQTSLGKALGIDLSKAKEEELKAFGEKIQSLIASSLKLKRIPKKLKDGKIGSYTLEKFQQLFLNGLEASDLLNKKENFGNLKWEKSWQKNNKKVLSLFFPDGLLKKSQERTFIKNLQRLIGVTPDGKLGPKSRSALQKFLAERRR